jgi:hypothetical protein
MPLDPAKNIQMQMKQDANANSDANFYCLLQLATGYFNYSLRFKKP